MVLGMRERMTIIICLRVYRRDLDLFKHFLHILLRDTVDATSGKIRNEASSLAASPF